MKPTGASASAPASAVGSRRRDVMRMVLIALAYGLAHRLTLLIAHPGDDPVPLWPPSGIALGALLLSPPRQRRPILAAIFVTAVLGGVLLGRPAVMTVGFMMANTLEAWGCVWLFERWGGRGPVTFARVSEVVALGAGAVGVNAVSALVGASVALVTTKEPFQKFYFSWWIADGLGILLVTPIMVVCGRPWRRMHRAWRDQVERIVVGAALVACAWAGFLGSPANLPLVPRPYWVFAPLVWAGLRFGTRATALLLGLLVLIGIGVTVTGRGGFPLGGAGAGQHLQMVQVFLGVAILTCLALAAAVAERRQLQAALEANQAALGEAQALIRAGSWQLVIDETGAHWSGSAELHEIYGLPHDRELTLESGFEAMHPDDRGAMEANWAAFMRGEATGEWEYRITVAGLTKWVHVQARAGPTVKGLPVRVSGTVQDITARKRAEDDLREREESYRNQFALNAAVMLVVNPVDGAVVDANEAAVAFYGYTRERLLAMSIAQINLLPEGDVRGAMKSVGTERGSRFEFRHRLADGSVRTVEVSASAIRSRGRLLLHSIIFDITERKAAEAEAARVREHYKHLLETATDGIHILDRDGNLEEASPSFYRMLGHDPGQKPRLNVKDWDVQWTPVELRAKIGELLLKPEVFETRMRRTDGRVIVVEISGRGIEIGGRTHLYASARDITGRKRAEEEMAEGNRRLALALDQAHLAHWEMDAATLTFTFNDRFYALYGTTALAEGGYAMTMEAYAREFLLPDEWPAVRAEVARMRADGLDEIKVEHRIRRRDGDVRDMHVRILMVRDAAGRIVGSRGANQDVTDQRRMEAALRRSEERLRTVVATMAEGVILHGADGVVIDCNPQAARMLGLTRDQVLGRAALDPRWMTVREDLSAFPGEDHPVMACLRTGASFADVVAGLKLPDGSLRWLNINAQPILGPGEGGPRAVVSTFSDITERIAQKRRLEALLAQTAQDARTKGELLREVNHRVANNLTAVLGLLAFENRHSDGAGPLVAPVLGRLGQRIRGLLQVHRMLSESAWAPVPVHELAAHLIHSVLQTAPWRKAAVVEIKPGEERVSPRQAGALAMVINELATNTVKYARLAAGPVRIGFEAQGGPQGLTLRYRDNGPGYPGEVIGLGRSNVGLKLVTELVQGTLGGSVEFSNEGGAVTTLRIGLEEETRT